MEILTSQDISKPIKEFDTLVLAGGGIKGFAILGAIQALMDQGYLNRIERYVSTSIGTVIAYLLIIGYTPIEIVVYLHTHKLLENIPFMNLVNLANGEGAISFVFIQDIIEKMTLEKTGKLFNMKTLKSEFGKSLYCATYNSTCCKTEYISSEQYPELPCLVAIRMSCNIPLIFERFQYEGNYYLDGGLTENFPISEAKKLGKNILGVNLDIPEKYLKDDPIDGLAIYLVRLLQIQGVHSLKTVLKKFEGDSHVKIVNIKMDDFRHSLQFNIPSKDRLELFSKGYNEVKMITTILN